MKYIKNFFIVFLIIMLMGFGLYFLKPDARGYLLNEDSLIENLSVGAYLISFILGIYFYINDKKKRKSLIILALVSLLGFFDELSFGERIFNLDMPYIRDMKIDSVHDFFALTYEYTVSLFNNYPTLTGLLFLSGLINIAAFVYIFWEKNSKFILSNYKKPSFIFAIIFSVLIFSSLVIDLDILEIEMLFMVEELFEFNASIALIFCGLALKEKQVELGQ